MATKKHPSGRRTTENEQNNQTPASPEAEKAGKQGGEIAEETTQYVYTVNKSTQQVSKIEEVDPNTGERKEIPMAQGYNLSGSYDPYAGWGYGGGAEYGGYGA